MKIFNIIAKEMQSVEPRSFQDMQAINGSSCDDWSSQDKSKDHLLLRSFYHVTTRPLFDAIPGIPKVYKLSFNTY